MTTQARNDRSDKDRDEALKDSFPASDPPANSGITGAEPTKPGPQQRSETDIPTGTPTSDRHATETAHAWEDETHTTPGKHG